MQVFGLAGFSGSGKTTLIERVLPLLRARGLRVAVLKHTHHDFDVDKPGKDSWRAREAGACAVLLTSARRSALLVEHPDGPPSLAALLTQLPPCDLLLVEGWKREPIPKLEVHRSATAKPWLCADDPRVLAVVADSAPPRPLPQFDLDAIEPITDFILAHADRFPTA